MKITTDDVGRIVQTRDGTLGIITSVLDGYATVHSTCPWLDGEYFNARGELHTEAGGGLDLVAFLDRDKIPVADWSTVESLRRMWKQATASTQRHRLSHQPT